MSLLFAPAAALAQGGTLNPNQPATPGGNAPAAPDSAAPQPSVRKQYPVWIGYVVILFIVAAIMGVSLIPSKRSHQD